MLDNTVQLKRFFVFVFLFFFGGDNKGKKKMHIIPPSPYAKQQNPCSTGHIQETHQVC